MDDGLPADHNGGEELSEGEETWEELRTTKLQ